MNRREEARGGSVGVVACEVKGKAKREVVVGEKSLPKKTKKRRGKTLPPKLHPLATRSLLSTRSLLYVVFF